MKIIYLTSVDPSQSNAPANHVSECVEIMARDHEVRLIHGTSRLFLKQRSQGNLVIKPIFFHRFHGGWRYFERRVASLVQRYSSEEETLLYMRMPPSGVMASMLLKYRGMKVMELNGLEVLESPHFDAMSRSVDLLLVGTTVSRSILASRFPKIAEKIFVHSNVGVNIQRFQPKSRSAAREMLGISGEDEVVVHVSGFQQHHDFDTLIKAIEVLKSRRTRLKLFLVGNGARMSEIVKQADTLVAMEAIVFVNEVDTDRLKNYIAAADVCVNVMTKKRHLQGNLNAQKTYEYIACERAVIESHDVSHPVPDWVRNSILLVPAEDCKCLIEALDSSICERDKWEERVSNIRTELIASHSWAAVVENTLAIVKQAMAVRRRTPWPG